MTKKLIVDLLLFVFMILEFSRSYLSSWSHELFGILLLVLMLLHLYLNRIYLKNIFKGKYNSKRLIMAAVNLSFVIVFSLSLIFGILSSEDILGFLNLRNSSIIKFHKIFSYLSVVLVGLHLGLNLNVMLINLQNLIKKRLILEIFKLIIIVYGIYSFFKHDILKHITGYYDFAFSYCSFLVNLVRYTSIVLAISLITNTFYSIIKIKEQKND